MNFPMLNLSIFNPQIIACLQVNDFVRTDDGTDNNFMQWQKAQTILVFNCNDLSVLIELPEGKPFMARFLRGFSPNDAVLFSFLMNSWEIIELNHCKLVTGNHISKSLKHLNYN
jgi:hypothetical protein